MTRSKALRGEMVLRDLIKLALQHEHRSGFADVLRTIAKAVKADACVLWQEVSGMIIPLAEGVSAELAACLPANAPVSAFALPRPISEQRAPLSLPNSTGSVTLSWLRSTHIAFGETPDTMLSAYSRNRKRMSPSDVDRFQELSALAPDLYKTIIEKMSIRLAEKLNASRLDTEQCAGSEISAADQMKMFSRQVCRDVAAAFDAVEVSLFLRDTDDVDRYSLVATTWPDLEFFGHRYKRNEGDSLTGWVLQHEKPLFVLDLLSVDRDFEEISARYPGLVWQDKQQVNAPKRIPISLLENEFRKVLGKSATEVLQPLNLTVVPVLATGQLLGVLRCCGAWKPPFNWTARERQMLNLVAEQIGQTLKSLTQRLEIERENSAWDRFVNEIGVLNGVIREQVKTSECRPEQLIEITLDAALNGIISANAVEFRPIDDASVVRPTGVIRRREPERGQSSSQLHVGLADAFLDAAERALATGEVALVPFGDANSPSGCSGLVVRIEMNDRPYGVIYISVDTLRELPPFIIEFVKLLGQQLELYLGLAGLIDQLRALKTEQSRTIEDFTHQLKSPMYQLHRRTQDCISLVTPVNEGASHLLRPLSAMRGLVSKALRVTGSLSLFADLSSGRPVRAQKRRWSDDDATRLVIECAADQEILLDPSRKLRFHVDRRGFDYLRTSLVEVDASLLFQAISNLLDNAGKYSFDQTTVRIYAGLTGSRRFHISVANEGLPISNRDVESCITRGWRSPDARQVTGEGRGIGLWIVSHIMKAHGGDLLVIPTQRGGLTEVKLIFPIPS